MGKIKSCAISLHGQKEVYREGELVSGVVVLDVLEPVTAKSIRIYCYGQSQTKWSREFTRDWNSNNIGSEKYFGHVVTLAANKGRCKLYVVMQEDIYVMDLIKRKNWFL